MAIIFTWVFNNTRGSLLLTMLLHASANTVIGTVFPTQTGYLCLYSVYLLVAVLLIVATRGRLSYRQDQHEAMLAASPTVGEQQSGMARTPVEGFPPR